jgi:hypothetical protein
MKFFVGLLFCSQLLFSFGQEQKPTLIDSSLIQLSGVVISGESLDPLAYTTIFDKTQRRGVIADYYGYFSMVVVPGDTLLFSFFGYKTSTFIVPDTLKDNRYSIIHMIDKDTLNLPTIDVIRGRQKKILQKHLSICALTTMQLEERNVN